ncbi:MAG: type VI secretion system Vgr family protein, partial [Gemmataceae bacterium]
MAPLSQAARRIRIKTPLADDIFVVTRLQGHEEISRLYHYEVELAATSTTEIAFHKLLGQPVRIDLHLPDKQVRHVHGIVKRLVQAEHDDVYTHYRLEVAPALWPLTLQFRSRIFSKQSVPDVLKAVLDDYQPKFLLRANYHARDYVVQYQESDFDFAARLMESEGLFFYFTHHEHEQRLVVTDDSLTHCAALPGQHKIHYSKKTGHHGDTIRIEAWSKAQELCIGKYKLWDHSFQLHGQKKGNVTPPMNLEASAKITEKVRVGAIEHKLRSVGNNDHYEQYQHDQGYGLYYDAATDNGTDQTSDLESIYSDNQRLAQVFMEERTARSLVIEGSGTMAHFQPGHHFELHGHPHSDGEYLITHVEYRVTLPAVHTEGDGQHVDFATRFWCQPRQLPFRAERLTPQPRIFGTQTATVVGSGDAEIACATYARVKVQFHWDTEGDHDGKNSRWVRVGQQWAGKNYGQLYIPRVGQEVIVSFLDGDPARPLIVGSVYNAANPTTHTLPDYAHFQVTKTQTVGSSGHSGTIISDQSNTVHNHTQSTRLDSVGGNHQTVIGGTHRHVASSRAQVTGGLPSFAGSGSGSGDATESSQWADFGWKESSGKVEMPGYEIELGLGAKLEAILGLKLEGSFGYTLEFFVDPFALVEGWMDLPGVVGEMGLLPHVAKTEMYIGNRTDYYMWGKKYTATASGDEKLTLTADSKVAGIATLRKTGQWVGYIAAVLGLADYIMYAEWAKDLTGDSASDEAEEITMISLAAVSLACMGVCDLIPFIASWIFNADKVAKKASSSENVVKNESADVLREIIITSSSISEAASLVNEIEAPANPSLTMLNDVADETVSSISRLSGTEVEVSGMLCDVHADNRARLMAGTETSIDSYAHIDVIGADDVTIDNVPEVSIAGIYMDVGPVINGAG